MNTPNVYEIAIFQVKPEFVGEMSSLRASLRETLASFGKIEFEGLTPVEGNTFADIAKWESLEQAQMAAKAFADGAHRFLPYMEAIESVAFMGYFTK